MELDEYQILIQPREHVRFVTMESYEQHRISDMPLATLRNMSEIRMNIDQEIARRATVIIPVASVSEERVTDMTDDDLIQYLKLTESSDNVRYVTMNSFNRNNAGNGELISVQTHRLEIYRQRVRAEQERRRHLSPGSRFTV